MCHSCLFHARWGFGTVPERSTRHTESICVHHTELLRNTRKASRKGSLWVGQQCDAAPPTGGAHWSNTPALRRLAALRGGTQLAGPGMQG